MSFISAFRVLCGKPETTPGTAETLADADFNTRVFEPTIGSIDVPMDMDPSKYSTGDFANGEAVPGPTSATLSFNCKAVNASGNAVPNWVKYATGCGCSGVYYSGETWGSGIAVYPEKHLAESSMTIGVYDLERGLDPSGLYYEFAGCMGNMNISVEGTGKPYMMNFEFTGALNDISDIVEADVPELTSPSTVIPDRFLNGWITIGGVSGCISSLELNLNNTISPVQCQSSTTGYQLFGITAQDITLTVNPLETLETTYDWYTKYTAGTVEEVIVQTEDFRIHIPRAQITSAGVEDADGLIRTPLTFRALRPSAAGSYNWAPVVIYTRNFA